MDEPVPALKWLRRAVLTGALLVSAGPAPAEAPVGASQYGQIMIAEYDIPAQTIARFAAHAPSADDPNESKLINNLLADTEDWVGPAQTLDAATNPYTLVVTLTGKARADGDVATMWQSGWQMEDGTKRLNPFPGLFRSGVKAGESVVLVRPSPPTRLSANNLVAPVLGLVRADNFEFESVRVQLWAGIGNPTKTETAFAFYGLWIGLGMLALWWWWRWRA